jgi:flagellar assembly protein FliH
MATIEVFQYPAVSEVPSPVWDGVVIEPVGTRVETHSSPAEDSAASRRTCENPAPERDTQAREALQSAFEEGRRQGITEGRLFEKEEQRELRNAAERRHCEKAAALAQSFTRERDQYFRCVEPEVVKLALAIAARILRRETQMDPLILTGAVRVALGQLSNSTRVRLRVPSTDLELWSETMAQMPNLTVRPEVLTKEGMQTGECVVETEIGTLNLGIQAQLDEIERGFFDAASAAPSRTVGISTGSGHEAYRL